MRSLFLSFCAVAVLLTSSLSVAHAAPCENGVTEPLPGTGLCVPVQAKIGLAATEAEQVFINLVSWIAFIFGSISLIVLIFCGVQYLLSAGDDSQAEGAKRCMKWAVVGMFVVGLSWTIVRTIGWLSFGLPPLF